MAPLGTLVGEELILIGAKETCHAKQELRELAGVTCSFRNCMRPHLQYGGALVGLAITYLLPS